MKSSLNIAMLAPCPYPTGQGTQALIGELAKGLHLRGHHIHLVTYPHGSLHRSEPFTIHRTPKIPWYNRVRSGPDLTKPVLDLAMVQTALRVVRDQKCHIIHAHNYEGVLVGAMVSRTTGVPLVYHAHNWMEDELPSYFHTKASTILARTAAIMLDRLLPRTADLVIALHRTMAMKIETFGVPKDKIKIINPGIHTKPWATTSSATKGNIIIYAGNMDSYQNLQLAFEAMALVNIEIPTARLVIATPNDPALARKLAEKHRAGRWFEVQHTPDMWATAKQYARAKVAVCPRVSPSGFPMKILNSMAAGVPVVACTHGIDEPLLASCEISKPTPESMAQAIVKLLINDAQRSMLAKAARTLVTTRYSRERMCEEVEKAWLSIL